MQAVDVWGELGAVRGLGGGPISQRGLGCFAVSQSVGDGEAGVSFQLGEHHQHLPVQRWHAVDGLEASSCGHYVEAVSAVTGDVEVVFRVAVLHHHDKPRPAVGQVVACHAFAPLVSLAFVFRQEDDGVCQRGGSRLHLLHHHLSGAVDGKDVAGEVLAWASGSSTGGTGDGCGWTSRRAYIHLPVVEGAADDSVLPRLQHHITANKLLHCSLAVRQQAAQSQLVSAP